MIKTNWLKNLSENEIAVLALVQENWHLSRPGLLERSPYGISKTDAIVKKLIRECIVQIDEDENVGKGRNPHLYSVNPKLAYFAGLELNATYDQLVIIDFAGRRVAEQRLPPSYRSDSISGSVVNHINSVLAECGLSREQVFGIGVASHGVIDRDKGTLHLLPHLGRATDKEFRTPIESVLRIPTFVAQPKFFTMVNRCISGQINSKRPVLNVNLGHGVGMGIAIDGTYYLGDTGVAGQIGHIRVPGWEHTCYCGNIGCLVTKASYEGICVDALERIDNGFITSIDRSYLAKGDYEAGANHVIDRAIENDKLAVSIIHDICYALAEVLSHVVTILNPGLLLINSNLVRAGDLFTGPVRLLLQKNTINESLSKLEIRFLPLDSADVADGAAFYALQRFLDRKSDCLILPEA